jgi:DNA-binding MarR family transcriptional regulator
MPSSLREEIHKKSGFESPQQEAALNVVRKAAVLSAGFERLFKGHGLSMATYNVLRILRGAGQPGRMCHEIAQHMVTRVPDVTRLVDRLEQAGLASRERCTKDRRIVYVRLTDAGRDLLTRLDRPVLELHESQLGHMSAPELEQVNELMVRARHPNASTA